MVRKDKVEALYDYV